VAEEPTAPPEPDEAKQSELARVVIRRAQQIRTLLALNGIPLEATTAAALSTLAAQTVITSALIVVRKRGPES
jgi:hypothetical protein